MSANKAIASVKANPKMAYPNSCLVSDGFLATELISDPKTMPIPAPAPARAIVAQPAPISLAPSNMIKRNLCLYNAHGGIFDASSQHLLTNNLNWASCKAMPCIYLALFEELFHLNLDSVQKLL